jgi:recombination protein RecA
LTEPIGNQTKVKVVKNKMAPPFRVTEFDIIYGVGISQVNELLELGVQHSIVSKSGAWFSYGSTRLGCGKAAAAQMLNENPEIAGEIHDKIMQACGVGAPAPTDPAGDAPAATTGPAAGGVPDQAGPAA